MSATELYNMDNAEYWTDDKFDFIYADYIFEDDDFGWIDRCWAMLKEGGVMAIHSDHQNYGRLKVYVEGYPEFGIAPLFDYYFLNEIVIYQEWGGRPKDRFAQKHDYILVFSKGKEHYFNAGAVQIPKEMISKGFNPSGRKTKTPSSLWHDLGNFSTTSGERVKGTDGKNIRWQKPLKVMRRLMYGYVKMGGRVLDPFLGSGTTGIVAKELDCDFVGIEKDGAVFEIAKNRLGYNGIIYESKHSDDWYK